MNHQQEIVCGYFLGAPCRMKVPPYDVKDSQYLHLNDTIQALDTWMAKRMDSTLYSM